MKVIGKPAGRPGRFASRPGCSRASRWRLIKVHAAGVNGADLREREGKYPVPDARPTSWGWKYRAR